MVPVLPCGVNWVPVSLLNGSEHRAAVVNLVNYGYISGCAPIVLIASKDLKDDKETAKVSIKNFMEATLLELMLEDVPYNLWRDTIRVSIAIAVRIEQKVRSTFSYNLVRTSWIPYDSMTYVP